EFLDKGVTIIVGGYVLRPLLQYLREKRGNPVVEEVASRFQTIAEKLKSDSYERLDENNISIWINLDPEQAKIFLRAMKINRLGDQYAICVRDPGFIMLV
ncbi:MAG TPA: hypothetical protein VEH77_07420, partial [Roseiarcus sp.]|nr:hypothetical protein [Roseiarcus sp.]